MFAATAAGYITVLKMLRKAMSSGFAMGIYSQCCQCEAVWGNLSEIPESREFTEKALFCWFWMTKLETPFEVLNGFRGQFSLGDVFVVTCPERLLWCRWWPGFLPEWRMAGRYRLGESAVMRSAAMPFAVSASATACNARLAEASCWDGDCRSAHRHIPCQGELALPDFCR